MFNEIYYNILNSNISVWPWPHTLYEKIFNDDDYQKILRNLPEVNHLSQINQVFKASTDFTNKRFILHSVNHEIKTHKFWWNVGNKFLDGKLKKLLLSKLRQQLFKRFDKDVFEKYDFDDTFQLTLDKPGYFLEPHTDAEDKVYTIIINLAKDNNNCVMGTEIHEKTDKLNLVKRTEYIPNTGVGVFKTNNSWHSVSKTKHDRWTIQYTIWAKPKNDT